VVENSAVTYTLGFYLPASEVDGKFHKLTVQVRRSGLAVTHPRGYFAYTDMPATQDESHNAFLAAIRSPLNSSALPLEIKIDPVDQPAPRSLAIQGTVGIQDLRLANQADLRQGTIDVYTIEQDAAGNVVHQRSNRLNLKLTEPAYRADLRSGIQFREVIQPEPSATVLRVLVQDHATSVIGSVIVPLTSVK
jgi:hypothetical protein